MNSKTAKLINRISDIKQCDSKPLKRQWNSMPQRDRANLRKTSLLMVRARKMALA